MRCIFEEYNTKKNYKIFFGFFITKGPHFFSVIANTKEGGGLLVATTIAIHLEEPVISAFLLNSLNFQNRKIFINLNFVMDRQSTLCLILSMIFCFNFFLF